MNILLTVFALEVLAMLVVAGLYSGNRISRTVKANLFLVLSIVMFATVGVLVWGLMMPGSSKWLALPSALAGGFLVTWLVLWVIKQIFFRNIPRQIN